MMAGILRGLAEVADPDDRFPLYVASNAPLPEPVAGVAQFPLHMSSASGGAQRLALRLPLALARTSPRPDLVFSLTHAPLWSPAPSVLLITDLSFYRHPDYYPLGSRLRLNQLVPRQARRATLIVTISEYSRRDIMDAYGLPEDQVAVVPCAVEPPPPRSEQDETALDAWLKESGVRGPFVLYLGNLHPRKNLPRLIEAFVRAREVSESLAQQILVVAGAGWWGGDRTAEHAAAAAPDGSVMFLGRVGEAQRDHLLRSASMLAYPSLFEGFGLPPLEAMIRGTPVLTSSVTSIPEVTGDAAAFVDPLDVDAIAGGLVLLADDPTYRDELRARGLRRAALFTHRRTGEAAVEAFRLALRRSRPRHSANR